MASMRHLVPWCRRASSAESNAKIVLRSLSIVRLIGAESGRAGCVVFALSSLSTAKRFVADRERRRTSYSSRGRAHWITHSPARGHKTAYYLRHTGHTAWHMPGPRYPHPLTRLCVWRLLPARLLTDPGLPGSMGIPGCAFHSEGGGCGATQEKKRRSPRPQRLGSQESNNALMRI